MKHGYIIAEIDVSDSDSDVFYNQYMVKVKPMLEKAHARFLVATDKPEVIEGGRNVKRIILVEFDTVDKAREFYFSEEYQELSEIRARSASTHLYIMEGLG